MWDKSPVLFADVVKKAAVKRVKDIATDMHTGVVDLSPVLTSNFVGNTNVSIDSADFTYFEGKIIGRSGALADGLSVINSLPDNVLHSVYISNGTPYGGKLETGWSRQAINGVYRITFMGVSMFYR